MANAMLETALTYLDMGWSVYPAHSVDLKTGLCTCGRLDCPCPGKHPIGSWTEFQRRLPTEQEVRTWFSVMECNVGTLTGRISGIAVVDIDGGEGIKSAKKLDLEPTLIARTGGGGFHMFYTALDPVPSRVKALPGIDIRGDGGYVVLPPSQHASGRQYEWLEPQDLAPFDPTLFNMYTGHLTVDMEWTDEILHGVSEGNRSNVAAQLCGRYIRLGLTHQEIWLLMTAWNDRNDPPLPEQELRRSVMAIIRKHETLVNPIQITTWGDIIRIAQGGGSNGKTNGKK